MHFKEKTMTSPLWRHRSRDVIWTMRHR